MKYGDVEMLVEYGSTTFTKKQKQIVRHYLDTDRSDAIFLGKEATLITCVILARSDDERISIEQLLHSDASKELHFHNFYYKSVRPSAEFVSEPSDYLKAKWRISAMFIALDPIPYSQDTGEALY